MFLSKGGNRGSDIQVSLSGTFRVNEKQDPNATKHTQRQSHKSASSLLSGMRGLLNILTEWCREHSCEINEELEETPNHRAKL